MTLEEMTLKEFKEEFKLDKLVRAYGRDFYAISSYVEFVGVINAVDDKNRLIRVGHPGHEGFWYHYKQIEILYSEMIASMVGRGLIRTKKKAGYVWIRFKVDESRFSTHLSKNKRSKK